MTRGREIQLSALLGRAVRDADGRVIGRIEELHAEVALDEGSEYVVREFHVGRFRALGGVASGRFARHFLRRLGRMVGYERYVVPWEIMDLDDPRRPVVRAGAVELRALARTP